MKLSETAVKMAHRYLTSSLADSAIGLLDEAAATIAKTNPSM